jgi:hypothetical protein
MSIFGLASGTAADTVGDDDAAAEDGGVGGFTGAREDIEALPLTWPGAAFWPEAVVAAGTVPKDFTPSDLRAGAAAGDEDIGADTSSIDPKVTAEPVKSQH